MNGVARKDGQGSEEPLLEVVNDGTDFRNHSADDDLDSPSVARQARLVEDYAESRRAFTSTGNGEAYPDDRGAAYQRLLNEASLKLRRLSGRREPA